MKIKLFLISLLFSTLELFSQGYKKQENESAENFAMRVLQEQESPNIELHGKVIETKLWNNPTKIIIAFFKKRILEEEPNYYVDGYVFAEIDKDMYQKILIDSYYASEALFKIESVFFANADNDEYHELCVLRSQVLSTDAESEGTIYNTVIYDDLVSKQLPTKLLKIESLENEFESVEGTYDDAPYTKAKYKKASDIKNRLRELGY
ncbi:MAG TPA: hypothetical protein VF676_03150 [Flavobacterium sp.]|jgi:hypothetical protein